MSLNLIPDNAIIIPENISDKYMAVSLTKDRVCLHLLKMDNYQILLDKKILPHLIDALIELHNRKEFDFPKEIS